MTGVYYTPGKFGLETVGEADDGGGYDFDKFVVWRNQRGEYLWAQDQGCSCPTPFEDYSLENLPIGTAADALNDLRVWVKEDYEWGSRATAAAPLIETLEALAHAPH